MNNSIVGRGQCETEGDLMWKLWVSLFVHFQFQAAGFPAQCPGLHVIWQAFGTFFTAYLAHRAEACVLKPGIKTFIEVREGSAN